MSDELEVCLDFESEPALVRRARRFVSRTLREWELEHFVNDAQLVVSELGSNAVLHARTEIRLTLRSDGAGWVRIEVQDHNSRMPTQLACPTDATSGRGLAIVEAVATSWGVARDGDGKTVWAELGNRSTTAPESGCAEVSDDDVLRTELAAVERAASVQLRPRAPTVDAVGAVDRRDTGPELRRPAPPPDGRRAPDKG